MAEDMGDNGKIQIENQARRFRRFSAAACVAPAAGYAAFLVLLAFGGELAGAYLALAAASAGLAAEIIFCAVKKPLRVEGYRDTDTAMAPLFRTVYRCFMGVVCACVAAAVAVLPVALHGAVGAGRYFVLLPKYLCFALAADAAIFAASRLALRNSAILLNDDRPTEIVRERAKKARTAAALLAVAIGATAALQLVIDYALVRPNGEKYTDEQAFNAFIGAYRSYVEDPDSGDGEGMADVVKISHKKMTVYRKGDYLSVKARRAENDEFFWYFYLAETAFAAARYLKKQKEPPR